MRGDIREGQINEEDEGDLCRAPVDVWTEGVDKGVIHPLPPPPLLHDVLDRHCSSMPPPPFFSPL